MRPVAVLYLLGWLLTVIAASMLVPAVFAAALDPAPAAQSFFVPAIIIGVIGVNLVFAFRGPGLSFGRRHNLLLVAAVWFVVPLAGALPFIAAGAPEGAIPAIFEAVSGFTTTGATVFADLKAVPRSIIVWRSLLQWLGGLTTLLAIAGLIGPLAGADMGDRQFKLISRGAEVGSRHLWEAVVSITPLYLALTAICFVLLNFVGIPPFDAFCLALSTISTGGFMPKDGSLALYGLPLAELVMSVFMVLGAVSFVWVRAVVQGQWSTVREMREPYWIIALVLVFGLLLGFAIMPEMQGPGPAGWLHALTQGLATVASFVTTSGFAVSDLAQDAIPFMAFVAICLVGGGRFSTAGGLKVFRIAAMMRQLERELRLLVYPHGVRPSRFGDEASDTALMKVVWTTLVAFVVTISVLAVLLGAAGLPFANAMIAAVSSVGNAGPVYEIVRVSELQGTASFGQMTPLAHGALVIGMILGRVEVVAILSIVSVAYWRN